MMILEFNSLKPFKYILYVLLLIFASCTEQKPPQVTFDIPALIGKNIDEVRKVLGKPYASPSGPTDLKKEYYVVDYHKDGQILMIFYNVHDRKVGEFCIVSSVEYDNVKDLLKIGNLDSMETKDYWIETDGPFFSKTFKNIKLTFK